MELDISEEEEVFRAISSGSKFTPANLNPSQSGPTLVKIIEGKYPSEKEKNLEAMQATANREVSKSQILPQLHREKPPNSTASRTAPQEDNLCGKID